MNILEYENYQEKKSHGSESFPYITYPCSIPLDFERVPAHWHDETEIIYIKKGCGLITVDLEEYPVQEGSILLILPGQVHSIEQYLDYKMNILILFLNWKCSLPNRQTSVTAATLHRF